MSSAQPRNSGHLGREVSHQYWDNALPPAMEISPGAEVALSLRDGANGQLTPKSSAADLLTLNLAQMDPLTGPIWIEGAQPGDALSVELLEISLGSWGWSAVLPNFGLLSDIFSEPLLKIWQLEHDFIDLVDGARFDLEPMIGMIGVAPASPGQYSSVIPTIAGGNIDVKYVQVGSRLLLPVFTDGALLSLGDAHALQGDGEINGTAIECEADVLIRIDLIKGADIDAPIVDTAHLQTGHNDSYRIFLGIGPDLWNATREASLRASEAIAKSLGVSQEEAYMFLGIVGELRLHEVVDRPNWVVGCMVPQRLFF